MTLLVRRLRGGEQDLGKNPDEMSQLPCCRFGLAVSV